MSDYLQPDFYRFNEDSIKLINFVLERNHPVNDILDLGCGCGIIGIEVSNVLQPKTLCLLEGQPEWADYIRKNIELKLNKGISVSLIMETFGSWQSERKFDLILCNPPYYLPGHGQPSFKATRDNARTFNIDNWQILLKLIDHLLTDNGRSCIVIKNDPRIIKEIQKYTSSMELIFTKREDLIFLELFRLNKN